MENWKRFSRAEWAKQGTETLLAEHPTVPADEMREVIAPFANLLTNRLSIADGPFLLGLTGSVAAGKSTFSEAVQRSLEAGSESPRVAVVSTDSFLLPNAKLVERGIMHRKGFPESYDRPRLSTFLADLREGRPVEVPIYSHDRYDIVPGEHTRLAQPDVLLLEGVGVGPHRPELDYFTYLDAGEEDLLNWYLARAFALRADARTRADSYFHRFRELDDEEMRQFATKVWEEVNLVNLREHILPWRDQADIIFRKGPDHRVEEVRLSA